MAADKKAIIVYSDWVKKFEALTDDEAGRLIKHFFRYVNDLNPRAPDRITELSFIDIEITLKRDLKKWENRADRSRKNGQLGGRPPIKSVKNKPTQTHQDIAEPKKPDSANVSVNVNDSVNVNANVTASVNGNVNEEGITPAPAKVSRKKREPSQQPVVFRESEYFDKQKFSSALAVSGPPYCNANPDFYYDACLNGSDSKGYKYLNWIAAVKNWMRKDIATGKFQSTISEPIKIVQGGKSNYKSERKAGYSDEELLSGLEEYRRRNQVANS